ncbi:hypothetical protein N7457_001894 [Penicillium paradoxum]|uniref:uncharacterized protein n=1 Tax=Penicillium paradoxum TaxID=176176 RepID=UPI0025491BAB|nr:uncharacterized protein N7457_001894 [Penicillium paradoxum]KAJ5795295.1 hypothetical protein N7457_001894 [Penicillium paradoxum]
MIIIGTGLHILVPAQGNVRWRAMMCPPCHRIDHDEQKGPWCISYMTMLMSLLALIYTVSGTLAKLLRKAIRRGINCYWEILDKDPLEERA